MEFTSLESEEQLDSLSASKDFQLVLKHNTTCSISEGVLQRLKAAESAITGIGTISVLTLPAQRELSNIIAGRFGVPHQSPQILLIRNGRCIYHEWGFDIKADVISRVISEQQ